MKHIRRFVAILGLLFLFIQLPANINADFVPNASKQSDTITTPYGTEYYLTATGKNTTFANNSINSFMVSVDVIQFGENVSGWYDVRLGYRLRNEALNWSMRIASDNTALISQNQPWFDYIFDVYVDETFPSAFNISLGVRFTENHILDDDSMSTWWRNILEITVSNTTNPLDAPSTRVPPPIYQNVTETIINVTETIISPHLLLTVDDQLVDINTNYAISWVLYASHPYQYRVNITNLVLGENRTELIQTLEQGTWVDGQNFTINSPAQAQNNGTYYYTIEANDDYGNLFIDTVRVAVLNFTYYDDQYPGLLDDLGDDLGIIAPAPLPIASVFIALFIVVLYTKKKR